MGNVDELNAIAVRLKRERKTTLGHDEAKEVSAMVSKALTDPSVDWSSLPTALERIPPSPIAVAVGETWSELPEDRRRLFLRWVSQRGGKRETRRSVQIAAVLLEHDVKAGVDLLLAVLPESDVAKETKVIIRTAFLDDAGTHLRELTRAEIPFHSALRIARALRQSVDTETPLPARYALAQLCLSCIARSDARYVTDATILWAATERDIRSWPAQMQAQFQDENRGIGGAVPQVPAVVGFFSVRAPERMRSATQPSSQAPVQDDNLVVKIDERIRTARDEITLLESIREALVAAPGIAALEKELAELKAVIAGLQQQLEHETTRANAASDRLATAEITAAASAAQLAECRTKNTQLEEHNKALVAQLAATGEIEMQQFKNRLAHVLARLITDLPERSTDLSPEAARVLLRQYHLFIDKVVDEGIPVRATSRSR